jgi:hypothetical protein
MDVLIKASTSAMRQPVELWTSGGGHIFELLAFVGLGHDVNRIFLFYKDLFGLSSVPESRPCRLHEHVARVFGQLHSKGVNLVQLFISNCFHGSYRREYHSNRGEEDEKCERLSIYE